MSSAHRGCNRRFRSAFDTVPETPSRAPLLRALIHPDAGGFDIPERFLFARNEAGVLVHLTIRRTSRDESCCDEELIS